DDRDGRPARKLPDDPEMFWWPLQFTQRWRIFRAEELSTLERHSPMSARTLARLRPKCSCALLPVDLRSDEPLPLQEVHGDLHDQRQRERAPDALIVRAHDGRHAPRGALSEHLRRNRRSRDEVDLEVEHA